MNRLGQRGETDLGWNSAAYAARARAFGWHAIELDGHDLGAIDRAYGEALAPKDQPTCLIARTEKGHGVSFVANKERLARQGLQPGAGESGHRRAGRRALAHGPDLQAGEPGAGRPARCTAAQAARLRGRRQGGDAQGLRRRAGRRRRQPAGGGRTGWRGFQLDLRRRVQEGLPRPVLRDVHRRAATRHRGGRAGRFWASGSSPRRSRPSSPGPTTRSAWPPSRTPPFIWSARTPGSASARTARRRWASRTWR